MTTAPRSPSAIGRAVLLLGDQWTLLILQRAFLGVQRFQGWRDALGVSESVLAVRLRDLVASGLLEKRPYRDGGRARHEYRLTESGLETWRILVSIWAWEKRWVARHADDLPELTHGTCGASIVPALGCGRCGKGVTPYDTDVDVHRSGGDYYRSSPPRRHRHPGSSPDPRNPPSFFPETMALLGDRWSTALLAAAFLRVRRFSDFQHELGIPPSVLAERLRRFGELGVLRHVPPAEGVRRAEYRLTDKGRAFFDVLVLLVEWGERFLPTPEGRQLDIVHRDCGQLLAPELICPHCDRTLRRGEAYFLPGPATGSGR
ncbi:MAG: transcriptional regulator [Streptosporangiales bacterium]|nr:transcriptional regulator [Streptosporangiales bacterium]